MSDFELPAKNKEKTKKEYGNHLPPEQPEASLKAEDLEGAKEPQKEKPLYSKEELMKVFDEIIFSGEYREEFIVRNKLVVTFRTRTGEEVNAIQKQIDSSGLNLISSVESMRSILNLQYALISYERRDLGMMKAEERAKFVERLPGPVIGMLIDLMVKFDQKVAAACREGEENF